MMINAPRVLRKTGLKEFKNSRLMFTCEKSIKNLSIVGKIRIIKTFLISQLVYIMQALFIPDHVLTDINRLQLYECTWMPIITES